MKSILSNQHLLSKFFILITLLCCIPELITGQSDKRSLDFTDYDLWNRITEEKISSDGSFVVFHQVPGKGDPNLKIQTTDGRSVLSYARGHKFEITEDANYVVFIITPHLDSIRALQRVKTPEKEMPCDTLGIYNVQRNELIKIPHVRSFEIPEEWNGAMVYTLDEYALIDTSKNDKSDTTQVKKAKKPGDKNGYHIIAYDLERHTHDTLKYIKDVKLAKEKPFMILHSLENDSLNAEGIVVYDFTSKSRKSIAHGSHIYEQLELSQDGAQAAYLVSKEDAKSYFPNYELAIWKNQDDTASIVLSHTDIMNAGVLNHHQPLDFSQDGSKLFFQTMPSPIKKDSTLLEDEVIKVEVWSYMDSRLHTQQNVEEEKDVQKGFQAVFHIPSGRVIQLGNKDIPEVSFGQNKDKNHRYACGINSEPYLMNVSWE